MWTHSCNVTVNCRSNQARSGLSDPSTERKSSQHVPMLIVLTQRERERERESWMELLAAAAAEQKEERE
jgi:hypothetical protein